MVSSKKTVKDIPIFDPEFEEEEVEEVENTSGNSTFGDREERQYEEVEPEAFIPEFTVVPELEVPIENVPLPSEEVQKGTFERLAKKLGMDIKKAIQEAPPPMSDAKRKVVSKTTHLLAQLTSIVLVMVFSAFGYEYSVLAPLPEESERMIEPFLKVYARHNKFIDNISEDTSDIIDGLTAISGYAEVSLRLLQEIRKDKALNGGKSTEIKIRPSFTSTRPNDIRGTSEEQVNTEPSKDGGFTPPIDTRNLTDEQRFNYEKLLELSRKDLEHRKRRAGII